MVQGTGKDVTILNEADFYDWIWDITVLPPKSKIELELVHNENGKRVSRIVHANLTEDEPLPELGVQW